MLWRRDQKAETHSISTALLNDVFTSVITDTSKETFDPGKEKSPRVRVFPPMVCGGLFSITPELGGPQEEAGRDWSGWGIYSSVHERKQKPTGISSDSWKCCDLKSRSSISLS